MAKSRILLIEDEVDLGRLFVHALARQGYEVRHAKNAETGLKAFRQWKPDLILLDLVLPGMSGLEFLELIRKTSDVYVILISGQRIPANGGLGGANDRLLKPFSLEELCAHVTQGLSRTPPSAAAPAKTKAPRRRLTPTKRS